MVISEVIAERGMTELETMPDQVRLLVEADPQCGIDKLDKAINGHSSRVLRSEFPGLCSRLPSWWMNLCFVAIVDGARLSVIPLCRRPEDAVSDAGR